MSTNNNNDVSSIKILQRPTFIQRILFFVNCSRSKRQQKQNHHVPKSHRNDLIRIVELAQVTSSWDDTIFEQGYISILWSSRAFQDHLFLALNNDNNSAGIVNPSSQYASYPSNNLLHILQAKTPILHKSPGVQEILKALQHSCATKESIAGTTRIRHAIFDSLLKRRKTQQQFGSFFSAGGGCSYLHVDKFMERGSYHIANDHDDSNDHLEAPHEITVQMFYCSFVAKHRVCGGFAQRYFLPSLNDGPTDNKGDFAVIITGQKGNNLLRFDHFDNAEDPYTWEIAMMPPAAYHHLNNYPTASDPRSAPSSLGARGGASTSSASPRMATMSKTGRFYATIELKVVRQRDKCENYFHLPSENGVAPFLCVFDVKTGKILRSAALINSFVDHYTLLLSSQVKNGFILSHMSFSPDDRFLFFGVNGCLCVAEVMINENETANSTVQLRSVEDFSSSFVSDAEQNVIFTSLRVSPCGNLLAAVSREQIFLFNNLKQIDHRPSFSNCSSWFYPETSLLRFLGESSAERDNMKDSSASFGILRAAEFHPVQTSLLTVAVSREAARQFYVLVFDIVASSSSLSAQETKPIDKDLDFIFGGSKEEGKSSSSLPRLLSCTLTGHYSSIFSMAISPNGKTLATGSRDQRIHLFDFCDDGEKGPIWVKRKEIEEEQESNTKIHELEGHLALIFSLSFCPFSSKILISGSYDATVRFWDVEAQDIDNAFQKEISLKSSVYGAEISNDGQILAICAKGGSAFSDEDEEEGAGVQTRADEYCRFYSVTRFGKRNRDPHRALAFRYPPVRVSENSEKKVYEVEDLSGEVYEVEV